MRKALQKGGPKKVHLIVCCSWSDHGQILSEGGHLDQRGILQPLWSKGPPSHKILPWSGGKQLRYSETDSRSVLYQYVYEA